MNESICILEVLVTIKILAEEIVVFFFERTWERSMEGDTIKGA